MKVFYDSNVVLDVLLNRTDFVSDSLTALKLSENKIVKGYISVVSITDIFYLVKKNGLDPLFSFDKRIPEALFGFKTVVIRQIVLIQRHDLLLNQ